MTLLAQAPAYAPPTGVFHLTWLLVALPAASAAVLLLGGRRTNGWGHLLGCATPIASFVIAVAEFFALIGRDGGQSRQIDQHLFSWIPVAGFQANANLLLDPLSLTFVLLITGVGSLIHIYSIGYMEHDLDRRRFFGELNLFVAAMLLLVLADNYLLLYVGWEGVGLASYLLIGFWQHKPRAGSAAQQALLVHRREEGVPGQPRRRRGPVDRDHADVHDVRDLPLRPGPRQPREARTRRGRLPGHAHRHRPDAAARRLRQVRPGAAAVLARGRDGGPDPGLGSHPRRDHGDRGRVPDRPLRGCLQRGARRTTGRHRGRRGHAPVRCDRR